MKKIIFCITLLVISVSSISAQRSAWGLRGSYLYYTLTEKASGMSSSNENAQGAELGVIYYGLINQNFYSNFGTMFSVMRLKGGGPNFYGYEIPFYLGVVSKGTSDFSLFAQAGIYYASWFSSNSNVTKILKWPQIGLGAIAGFNIKKFKVEIGYKYGLTNFMSAKEGEYSIVEGGVLMDVPSFTLKLSSLSVGVSYVF